MTIITLVLAVEIVFGWMGLLIKKTLPGITSTAVLAAGAMYFIFGFLANWLQVNQELVFLFGVGIGSMGFLGRLGIMPNPVFLLFLGALGYYWYVLGFLPALYLFLLASAVGGLVVQPPLRLLGECYERITTSNQVAHAYIFSIVGFGNIILFYILYGISK